MQGSIRTFQQLQSQSIYLDNSVLNSKYNTIFGDYGTIYYKYLMVVGLLTSHTNIDLLAKFKQHIKCNKIEDYIPTSTLSRSKSDKFLTTYNRKMLYNYDVNGTSLIEHILTTVSNFIK